MEKIEFTMNKIFTFGSKDTEDRFMIRNHFLENNPNFNGFENKDDTFEVIIDIEHNKSTIDIDNVPKVIIDAFSASQIQRDLLDWDKFLIPENDLSANKRKEFSNIVKLRNDFYESGKYTKLGIYKDDTISFIQKLTCTAKVTNKSEIHVVIQKAL